MPFVTVNDKPIYYESVGTGEPLVLIHALLMNGRMWSDQVAVFSEKYRVITVDLYGYGKSKLTDVRIVDHPADIKGFLDALGIEKTLLLGLSMGSIQALCFALENPDMVKKLALISTGIDGFEYPDSAEEWWHTFIGAVKGGDLPLAKKTFSEAFINGSHYPADDAMKARANAMMNEYDFCHFLDDTLLWKEYGAVADRLNVITCPVLVMAGDNEHPNYLAVETAEYVASKFPNAKKSIIANAGHFINWQQPEAFNRVVLDFLAD
jgi:pimeloyl-ACP methyl ester carboxylesterase